MEFKAKTVQECWTIIREETENWQERANSKNARKIMVEDVSRECCLVVRDVLDSISLRILYGEKREP